MSDWTPIGECLFPGDHLWRYEPDLVNGGSYLLDSSEGRWVIRTCAICGERERRKLPADE